MSQLGFAGVGPIRIVLGQHRDPRLCDGSSVLVGKRWRARIRCEHCGRQLNATIHGRLPNHRRAVGMPAARPDPWQGLLRCVVSR